jgi:thioredoxin 1
MVNSQEVVSITGTDFEALIQKNDIVFVDFWAPWCQPCKQFGLIYDRLPEKYPNIVFGKIDVQDETELSNAFHIQSIPHLMVFKKGIAIYSESGIMPESTLKELIQQAIDIDVSAIRAQLDQENE